MTHFEKLLFCSGGNLSIKLFCNFNEITIQHGCSLEILLHNFRASFTEKHLWRTASVNVSKSFARTRKDPNETSFPRSSF